ncbi:MAG: pyruvate ferredoxin oxidoreductase [Chloroflexi bacterium]|nr:pyruvate ferredoxin oxidoreductase [Chloroflexota bacterium]
MPVSLKELSTRQDRLAAGHRLCPGCAEPIIVRMVLNAIPGPVVVANATGCLEVSSTPYPFTSWRVPWIHNAFENAASSISGVEAAYRSFVHQGKMKEGEVTFLVFAGDGATYDIGLQWISGAVERGHRFVYVCLNNEAYMNTGIQRSGATPIGAWTTTSPVGSAMAGKREWRKDMTAIMAAHNMPYVAQAAIHAWRDLITKVEKAVAAQGPAFINVLSPCPLGWRVDADQAVALSRLGMDTCLWPLYEVDHGQWRITQMPRSKLPIAEWVKAQGRFSHLRRPENEGVVKSIQAQVDAEWEALKARCGV